MHRVARIARAGLALVAGLVLAVPAVAQSRLAPTPPMGFNTWNRFGCDVRESLVREMADAIVASGMKAAGYRYVVIDDCWQVSRDAGGRIVPDPERFPRGIKPLADYIHGLGLSFGIYTDIGPKTCAGRPGSYGHFEQDAKTYAAWGVDYVKVDWCHADSLDAPTQYTRMRRALDRAGRPIVLSICEWGQNHPWEWAGPVGQLWRTTDDISDNWQSVVLIANASERHAAAAGPGHWNDPDMLEVGNGGMTADEYRTHFTLWAMMAAPLMAGNDIRTMTDATRAILTNPEVIAVDQDRLGQQGRIVVDRGSGTQVWLKRLADGSRAVAAVNYRSDSSEVSFQWKEVGLAGSTARVRDLWRREDLGAHTDPGTDQATAYRVRVPPHGVALFRITPGR